MGVWWVVVVVVVVAVVVVTAGEHEWPPASFLPCRFKYLFGLPYADSCSG